MTAHNTTINRARKNTRGVTGLSACGLYLGDMIELVTLEGIDVICIQCGHRAPSQKNLIAAALANSFAATTHWSRYPLTTTNHYPPTTTH